MVYKWSRKLPKTFIMISKWKTLWSTWFIQKYFGAWVKYYAVVHMDKLWEDYLIIKK